MVALRIAVFGAGAVGSLVAARLAQGGADVTVVARGRRLADIAANGLRLCAPDGSVTMVPVATASAADAGSFDVVFIAVKGGDIPAALGDLQGLVGADTVIVPLVNGIPWWYALPGDRTPIRAVDPEGSLIDAFEPAAIVGAVLFVTCALGEDGIVTVRGAERVVMGPVVPEADAVRRLEPVFAACPLDTLFVPDIRRDLWAKVALNFATNPLSVVTGATLEEQFNSEALQPNLRATFEDVTLLARRYGIEPRLSVEQMIEVGKRAGPFLTSMAQDYQRGTRLELGAICMSVFELAERADIRLPTAGIVYDMCRFLADKQKV